MTEFNPKKYQGTWFEFGKYPVPYEVKPCKYSTAEYRYNSDGNYINVLNTCYDEENKPIISITGLARPTNQSDKFLIKFYPESYAPYPVAPGEQPYNVLWTDYNNFAFVGDRNSYYILSRKRVITQEDLIFIINKTKELGYDIFKVRFNNL